MNRLFFLLKSVKFNLKTYYHLIW